MVRDLWSWAGKDLMMNSVSNELPADSKPSAPPEVSLPTDVLVAGSVEQAVAHGLRPGRNFVTIGRWELGIDTNGNVIYHAVYRP